MSTNYKPKSKVLGAGDSLGADSHLVLDVLPKELADEAFEKMVEEVDWNTMRHRGGEVPRLVAVEGEIYEDGSYPIYRHPADESPPLSPFSPTVALIRSHVQQLLPAHPINHVLIQQYRTGADYISEHSDKTIDVVRGSNIVNVSLGAQRVMTLRTKKDSLGEGGTDGGEGGGRITQRIPLPHNSMFVMGPETNKRWMHSIHHDNRPTHVKMPEERGARISLTFRSIGTYLFEDVHEGEGEVRTMIYGQGARGKTRKKAGEVQRGEEEAQKLLEAFGRENHESEFDWDGVYGAGFDVVNFGTPPPSIKVKGLTM